MKQDITFFLPTRKGSQRVKNKNTRQFSDVGGGILELKLRQLRKSKTIDEIILSTNDEVSMDVAARVAKGEGRIKVIPRPEELCLDSTLLTDLIRYVPGIVSCNHIIWGHVTTPFVDGADYDNAINEYFLRLKEGFDSLISVMVLQNFLLRKDGTVFNNDGTNKWPRTQDLPKLYEVNHAMFITSKDNYKDSGDRVGSKPFLYEQDKIKSFDIDWEDDFLIAEAIYDKLQKV